MVVVTSVATELVIESETIVVKFAVKLGVKLVKVCVVVTMNAAKTVIAAETCVTRGLVTYVPTVLMNKVVMRFVIAVGIIAVTTVRIASRGTAMCLAMHWKAVGEIVAATVMMIVLNAKEATSKQPHRYFSRAHRHQDQ